jgi:hypothetical protein
VITKENGLSSGVIAGIVIGSVAGALLIAAAVLLLVRSTRSMKRKAAVEAEQVEALVWTEDDERRATTKLEQDLVIVQRDETSRVPIVIDFGGDDRHTELPTFSVTAGTRMPVNRLMIDKMNILNNSTNKIYYRMTVPQSKSFEFSARPGIGSIAAKQSIQVRILLKLVSVFLYILLFIIFVYIY